MERDDLLRRLERLFGREAIEGVDADLDSIAKGESLPRWLEDLVTAAEALPLPEVPAVVSQDLHRLFDQAELAESHTATMVRDSRSERDLVGVRGADGGEGWTLSYTSPVADVVIDVWPEPDGSRRVEGQVLGHGAFTSAYRAVVRGPVELSADGDRLGRFDLGGLDPARYTVDLSDGRIRLALDLDLSEETP